MYGISTFTFSGLAGFGLACIYAVSPEPAPVQTAYQIVAVDAAGDSYIAGEGDDCAAAWEGARLPSDWRDVICVPISR